LRKRGCRSYQNTFAISANISRNQHASMSCLPRLISSRSEDTREGPCEASRWLG
jgi:hypothetical protein